MRVTGLGSSVVSVTGAGSILYAAGADGVIRTVSLSEPSVTRWAADVGSRITGEPLPAGPFLLVLVDGGMAAVAR